MKIKLTTIAVILALLAAACGGTTTQADTQAASNDVAVAQQATDTEQAPGIRLVSALDGADIQNNPPEDLVILDVRTPEEFAAGHVDGAIMIDFYAADFEDRVAELDPDVPYLLYCNSGNRSGQTVPLLHELGFNDVADVDGGIQAWMANGLPTVTP